jgi:hypothetical protein
VETGELDTQRTQIGGESIDLGSFRQYVHRREAERQVEIAFEIDPQRLSGQVAALLHSARGVVVEAAIGAGFTSEQRTLFGALAREIKPQGGARVERFAIEVDGAPLLSISARAGGRLRLDRLDHSHPVFRSRLDTAISLAAQEYRPTSDESGLFEQVLDSLVPSVPIRATALFPRIDKVPEHWGGPAFLPDEVLMGTVIGTREDHLFNTARLFLPSVLSDFINGLSGVIEEEIHRLRYLGPLRSYPPRHLAFSEHHDPNWFAGGGYAWDVVRTREEVRRRVNAWLGDPERLKTPYELKVRDLLPTTVLAAELSEKVTAALQDLADALVSRLEGDQPAGLPAVFEELRHQLGEFVAKDQGDEVEGDPLASATDAEAIAERWVEEIVQARSEGLQDLVLVDKRSATSVSHRDVGIGISQVLPVLVSAFASKEKLIAIEQPEIHLHPALQAELGDVFIESALGERRNTFLLETHSEHLILRILRRIRETAGGDLPEGATPITPDQVAVVYVQPGKNGAEVIHIPVNEDGEFERPWPEGFFAERARELF